VVPGDLPLDLLGPGDLVVRDLSPLKWTPIALVWISERRVVPGGLRCTNSTGGHVKEF